MDKFEDLRRETPYVELMFKDDLYALRVVSNTFGPVRYEAPSNVKGSILAS